MNSKHKAVPFLLVRVGERFCARIRRKQFEDEQRRIRAELLQKEIETTEARAVQELAEARAAMAEELAHKNKELEAFSYSVSHDLRTPLRSIDGFSRILLEEYGDQLDVNGKGYLNRVRAAAQRMGELIDDLLKLSSLSRAELHREQINLSDLTKLILEELHQNDPHRNVAYDVQDNVMVWADKHLMRVVLENLLGNAWKFTSKQQTARISFGIQSCDGIVACFVGDNGAGFDMAYVEKLFRPFQRLHGASDFPGSGIGLAAVHRIIDRHGGTVWADAEESRGATFLFTIPTRPQLNRGHHA